MPTECSRHTAVPVHNTHPKGWEGKAAGRAHKDSHKTAPHLAGPGPRANWLGADTSHQNTKGAGPHENGTPAPTAEINKQAQPKVAIQEEKAARPPTNPQASGKGKQEQQPAHQVPPQNTHPQEAAHEKGEANKPGTGPVNRNPRPWPGECSRAITRTQKTTASHHKSTANKRRRKHTRQDGPLKNRRPKWRNHGWPEAQQGKRGEGPTAHTDPQQTERASGHEYLTTRKPKSQGYRLLQKPHQTNRQTGKPMDQQTKPDRPRKRIKDTVLTSSPPHTKGEKASCRTQGSGHSSQKQGERHRKHPCKEERQS